MLLAHLGDLPTLLIVDNCEHLVEAVAGLVDVLLTRRFSISVVTTTRAHRRPR